MNFLLKGARWKGEARKERDEEIKQMEIITKKNDKLEEKLWDFEI